ncbi:MAG: 23S rRNA (adenine(2503)-C(2))-methyltransferase RlmN, partial [Planctomycetota bacterium]
MPALPPHLLDRERSELVEQLRSWLTARSEPAYRTHQILEHLFLRGVDDPLAMANLPVQLRRELGEQLLPPLLRRDQVQVSSDGTRKYRFRLRDGVPIESVWIPGRGRNTLCVSSQAGCPAACSFCATGAGGFRRNLSPGEILSQWLEVARDVRLEGQESITQIVFMGMGEPLYNYKALSRSLRTWTDPEGFSSSPRRITVSTVGITPKIPLLAREFPQVRLAVSLHSARNETRDRIVPVNRRYPIEVLHETLRSLQGQLRRVSLEYVLLAGVNDSASEAKALARFARDTAGH